MPNPIPPVPQLPPKPPIPPMPPSANAAAAPSPGTVGKTNMGGTVVAVPTPDGKPLVGVVKPPIRNIAERAAWTALQTFLGTVAAVQITNVSTAKQAGLAGIAAVGGALLSIVKTAALEYVRASKFGKFLGK